MIRASIAANATHRLADSSGVAHSLHRLELYLARNQSRAARSAADFLRRDSLPDRNHRSHRRLGRPGATSAAASRLRLPVF